MPSRRQRILAAIKAVLEGIRKEHGYQTDLGLHVELGEVTTSGPDDAVQVLAIVPREDQVSTQQVKKVSTLLPVDIAIILGARVTNAFVVREQGLADVRSAMEQDLTLGGLLTGGFDNPEGLLRGSFTPFDRTSGTDYVGGTQTYACHYRESLGHPEA